VLAECKLCEWVTSLLNLHHQHTGHSSGELVLCCTAGAVLSDCQGCQIHCANACQCSAWQPASNAGLLQPLQGTQVFQDWLKHPPGKGPRMAAACASCTALERAPLQCSCLDFVHFIRVLEQDRTVMSKAAHDRQFFVCQHHNACCCGCLTCTSAAIYITTRHARTSSK